MSIVRRRFLSSLAGALALSICCGSVSAQPIPREPLEVMTFNIRYGTAKDGENEWSARREFLFDVIRERDADLIGHLDHQSQPSRERSTVLLRQRIAARAFAGDPVIVTGDFNVGERNPALSTLVSKTDASAPFVDTYRVRYPDETVVGTFSGFTFGVTSGEKIDYILVQPGTEVLSAEIIRTSRNDRYPSDHFPVAARVRLPAGR